MRYSGPGALRAGPGPAAGDPRTAPGRPFRAPAVGAGSVGRTGIIKPKGATGPLPVVIYIHGAGWVFHDEKTHDFASLWSSSSRELGYIAEIGRNSPPNSVKSIAKVLDRPLHRPCHQKVAA